METDVTLIVKSKICSVVEILSVRFHRVERDVATVNELIVKNVMMAMILMGMDVDPLDMIAQLSSSMNVIEEMMLIKTYANLNRLLSLIQ